MPTTAPSSANFATSSGSAKIYFKNAVTSADKSRASIELWLSTGADGVVSFQAYSLKYLSTLGAINAAGIIDETGWGLTKNLTSGGIELGAYKPESKTPLTGEAKVATLTFSLSELSKTDGFWVGFDRTQGAIELGYQGKQPVQYNELAAPLNLLSSGSALDLTLYHWKNHAIIADSVVTIDSTVPSKTAAKSFLATGLSDGSHNIQVNATSADRETAISLKDALAALKLAIGVDSINSSSTGASNPASPYQRAAADFNGDGKVDLKDALEILKYSIGVTTANTPRWQFYDESEVIAKGAKPAADFSQAGKTVSINADRNMNLVAVLTGDVDGSWAPPSGSTIVDSQHFTALVTLLQAANDTDVSLARWGIYG
jgi:hypothetical protein